MTRYADVATPALKWLLKQSMSRSSEASFTTYDKLALRRRDQTEMRAELKRRVQRIAALPAETI